MAEYQDSAKLLEKVGDKRPDYSKYKRMWKEYNASLESICSKMSYLLSHYSILFYGDFKNATISAIISKCLIPLTRNFSKSDSVVLYQLFLSYSGSLPIDKNEIISTVKNWFCKDRDQIMEKLEECRKQVWEEYKNSRSDMATFFSRNIVYLMVQPELSNFPWEMIQYSFSPLSNWEVMGSEQHFLRIPNFDILQGYLEAGKKLPQLKNLKKWYYLISPTGGLKYTEDVYGKFWRQFEEWNGLVKEKPKDEETFYSEFKKSEMYLYCGHGVGADMFTPMRLARQKFKTGCIVLGWCSSSTKYNGPLEMTSYIPYFFISGWPFFAGCLWNVLDRDIDEYSRAFLNNWFEQSKIAQEKFEHKKEIPQIEEQIVRARKTALEVWKYKYLTGRSLAFYGMPLILFNN
jgi:hypothetical protein